MRNNTMAGRNNDTEIQRCRSAPFAVQLQAAQTNPAPCSLQGADTIHRLVRDGAPGNFKLQGEIKQPPGSGPRHIVVRGDQLYTIHEDSSTLTQQTIPSDPTISDAPLTANVALCPPTSNFYSVDLLDMITPHTPLDSATFSVIYIGGCDHLST